MINQYTVYKHNTLTFLIRIDFLIIVTRVCTEQKVLQLKNKLKRNSLTTKV